MAPKRAKAKAKKKRCPGPATRWTGTLNNPQPDELKDLWVFNQPHGPVPGHYKLNYIVIGMEHWDGPGTRHLQMFLEVNPQVRLHHH